MKKEFPTETGWYWFYGWTSASGKTGINGKKTSPRLHTVRVSRGANSLIYICDGNFMYKSEGEGIWLKMEVPEFTEDML